MKVTANTRNNNSKIMKYITSMIISILFAVSASAQEQVPNRNERIYTLSELWKELEYNFAFPENLREANLDSLYQAYLPVVEQAEDPYDYYRALSAFMARFNEPHTRIIPPQKAPYDMPPIVTSNVGDRVYVKNISTEFLEQIPLHSEIIAVDQIPVMQFLESEIYPYIAAANPRWKRDKAITEMFYGRPDSTVEVTIVTPKGKTNKVTLKRDYLAQQDKTIMADDTPIPSLDVQYLKDGIGYLHLTTCVKSEISNIENTFFANLDQLLKCKGLIVDVRGNRGGTDQAWYMLAYVSMPGETFGHNGKWWTKKHIAEYKSAGMDYEPYKDYYEGTVMEEVQYPPYKNNVPDSLRLRQPMVILSGQYVGSAAEDYVEVMKENHRATIVGEPTVGCMSGPTVINLPGGYSALICVKSYVPEDGSNLLKTGILPDIEVKQDFDRYMKGHDDQLAAAIKFLKEQMK